MRLVCIPLLLAACGGGGSSPAGGDDAGPGGGGDDAGGSDAAGMPAAPALFPQVDRMGRPGVVDTLIAVLPSAGADPASQKAIYNQAADPATWKTTLVRPAVTIEAELMASIAAFDALDLSLGIAAAPGCSNTLGFAKPVSLISYRAIADVIADDQIYLDTARPTCTVDLALELEAINGQPIHTTCGGRTPAYDALDVLYSVLMAGAEGLDLQSQGAPRVHGTATVHADVSTDMFPFLGPPSP